MPTLRPYQMRVRTPQGITSYTCLAQGGCDAISTALETHHNARRITAKPVTTHHA